MEQKNKVLVKINGQEYPIVGAEPKEHLLKVGNFVDEKMEQIAKANKKLSTSMIAVLTSINIADQYLKLQSSFEELKKQLSLPQQEIDQLQQYIESLQHQLEERKEANSRLEEQLIALEQAQDSDVRLGELKNSLAEKEEDLLKAENLINDLQNKLFDNQIKLVQARKELEEYVNKTDYKK